MTNKYDLIINKPKFFIPKYNFNYFNVRNNAWEFLIKNKVNKYPLDLRTIAINNNWHICSYNLYCKMNNISIDDLIKKHPSGFTEKYNGLYLICYNQNNSRQHNRFTICHEFGHIVLKHFYKGDKLEKEANMFSARILMPMLLIKELNINSPEELANICDVSIEAATFRLKRFNEVKGRERFYTNPREQQLYQQLKEFIINKRKE